MLREYVCGRRRHPIRKTEIHAPTIGILLCASRNEAVGRYALGSTTAAMAVSTVSYENLPPAERAELPPAEVIEAAALSVAGADEHGTAVLD
jgi:hypothetical protein